VLPPKQIKNRKQTKEWKNFKRDFQEKISKENLLAKARRVSNGKNKFGRLGART
jgi:hypothetical protein